MGLGRTDSRWPVSLTGRKLPDQQPTLDVAVKRRSAHRAGHLGAMYPWQSGSDGSEVSQQLHLNPRS
ncbi:hypothetical protein GR254_22895, partial [Mycobacterium tuberculosis]|nr:hypothetical protein [Mycobacterium tuberculosis]